jgi:hypothetical protein
MTYLADVSESSLVASVVAPLGVMAILGLLVLWQTYVGTRRERELMEERRELNASYLSTLKETTSQGAATTVHVTTTMTQLAAELHEAVAQNQAEHMRLLEAMQRVIARMGNHSGEGQGRT